MRDFQNRVPKAPFCEILKIGFRKPLFARVSTCRWATCGGASTPQKGKQTRALRQRQTDFCVTVTARSPARDFKMSTSRAARKFCTSRHRLHYKIVQTWLVVTMDERESLNLCVVGQQFIIAFNLPLRISENQARLARTVGAAASESL